MRVVREPLIQANATRSLVRVVAAYDRNARLASPLPCLFIKRHTLPGHDHAVLLSSGRRGRGFGLSLSG